MIGKLIKILIILVLLPYAIVPVYYVLPPISLPLLGETITMKETHWRWRSLKNISPNLKRAIIAAEDARFCEHKGVDWQAVEKVVDKAKRTWKLKRGASTITMQTAKNLFLWYYPDMLRKPLEIPLAMWIDFVWGKKRTIEVYMNIAEMGDGVYGAEAAAQKHFKKSAKNLSRQEASLITATLPNPIKRKAGKPSGYVKSYASSIRGKSGYVVTSCTK